MRARPSCADFFFLSFRVGGQCRRGLASVHRASLREVLERANISLADAALTVGGMGRVRIHAPAFGMPCYHDRARACPHDPMVFICVRPAFLRMTPGLRTSGDDRVALQPRCRGLRDRHERDYRRGLCTRGVVCTVWPVGVAAMQDSTNGQVTWEPANAADIR